MAFEKLPSETEVCFMNILPKAVAESERVLLSGCVSYSLI